MASPQLPIEVLLEIVQYQSANADLRSTALTNKALRDGAQRALFHNPVPCTAYRHLLFIDAILSSPHRLGPMVKVFVHVSGSAYLGGRNEEYISKTRRVLHAMYNLKRLAFRNAWKLPASVLDDATFELDAFDWGSAHDNAYLLRNFLPTQPRLKHLTFYGDHAPMTPENLQLCSQLRSLTGGRAAVELFVTGKRVTHLQWMPQTTGEELFFASGLESEFGGVYFLGCRITWEGYLPRFTIKLRSLVLLEITGRGIVRDLIHHELQFGLEGIPTLQVLILVEDVAVSPELINSLHTGDDVRNIFAQSSYLEHIDISFPSTDQRRHFRRFHRANVLGGTHRAGTVIDEATVYAWKSLSNFGGCGL